MLRLLILILLLLLLPCEPLARGSADTSMPVLGRMPVLVLVPVPVQVPVMMMVVVVVVVAFRLGERAGWSHSLSCVVAANARASHTSAFK